MYYRIWCSAQHEAVLTIPSTPANLLRLLMHTCQSPPQFLAGALVASDIRPASISFGLTSSRILLHVFQVQNSLTPSLAS